MFTMKKVLTSLALIGAAAATVAAVTFNPMDGTGFVGKGDVQQAFGWNNAQTQLHAGEVTFTYTATDTYAFTCEWWTGPERNRTQHFRDHKRTADVSRTIAHELRVQRGGVQQVTGFNLTGFGAGAIGETGGMPQVGDACPGNPGNGAVVVAVMADPVSSVSALMVNHPARESVKIWPLPSL